MLAKESRENVRAQEAEQYRTGSHVLSEESKERLREEAEQRRADEQAKLDHELNMSRQRVWEEHRREQGEEVGRLDPTRDMSRYTSYYFTKPNQEDPNQLSDSLYRSPLAGYPAEEPAPRSNKSSQSSQSSDEVVRSINEIIGSMDISTQSSEELERKKRLIEEERELLGDVLAIEKQITEETREQIRLTEQKAAYFKKYGQSEGMRAASAGIDLSRISDTSEAYGRGEAYTRQSGEHTIIFTGNKSGL